MTTLFNQSTNPSQQVHETNIRTAHCQCGCGRVIPPRTGVLMQTRGNVNGGYYSVECATRIGSYGLDVTTVNPAPKTTEKVTEIGHCTIGFEFESVGTYAELQALRAILCYKGMAEPTHDCTVDIEFKTTPVTGFARHSRLLKTIETDGLTHCLDNEQCGAHIHIGHPRYTDIQHKYVERFYHSLFVELSDYISAHPTETKALFGRDLTGEWAEPISPNSHPMTHSNYINMQHCNYNGSPFTTIEFRLPHVVSQAQYILCAQCAREMAFAVFSWAWNFNEDDSASAHKNSARACGSKLVKIFTKYAKKALAL